MAALNASGVGAIWTKKNHRAGCAFVHLSRELSASALRLHPTALRSGFDLLALRARCKSKPRRACRRLQGSRKRGSRNLRRLLFGHAELAVLVTCSKGKKIHRAGCAFVRLSRERSAFRLAASAYCPQERLRPTRAPCSVQGETYAVGHGSARGERPRK